jgi:hypothetical protein
MRIIRKMITGMNKIYLKNILKLYKKKTKKKKKKRIRVINIAEFIEVLLDV